METQSTTQWPILERALLDTVRKLHPRRVVQVLDFARWLQTQPLPEELLDEEMTEAELELEEMAWEQVYLANRENFRAMARQALNDLDAGETLEMVIENNKISAR